MNYDKYPSKAELKRDERPEGRYIVTYTRLLAGGERITCTGVMMSETDLYSLFLDDSCFQYIVISAHLLGD